MDFPVYELDVSRPKYRRRKKTLKSVLTALVGISVMYAMARYLPGARYGWVEADYHQFQGNYMGTMFKGNREYVVIYKNSEVRSFEINPGISLSLPHLGAMVEVHYNNEQFPKIMQGRDLKAIHIPDPAPENEGLPTRYGVF